MNAGLPHTLTLKCQQSVSNDPINSITDIKCDLSVVLSPPHCQLCDLDKHLRSPLTQQMLSGGGSTL